MQKVQDEQNIKILNEKRLESETRGNTVILILSSNP